VFDNPEFTPEEEELMKFSRKFTSNMGMSKDEIEQTIATNWTFFSGLIAKGITINHIREFVNQENKESQLMFDFSLANLEHETQSTFEDCMNKYFS